MKKIFLAAAAGSAMMLAGCGPKAEEPAADASPAAEASADTTASDAASGDAAAATASDAAGANESTNGGTVKP